MDVENNSLTVLSQTGSRLELDESESIRGSSDGRSSLGETQQSARRRSHFVKPQKVGDKADKPHCIRKKHRDSGASLIKEDEDQDEDIADDQGNKMLDAFKM